MSDDKFSEETNRLLDDAAAKKQREAVAAELDAAIIDGALPSGVVVIDKDDVIIRVNSAVEMMFSYLRSELIGKKVEILVPEALREVHEKRHRPTYFHDPRTRPMGIFLGVAQAGVEKRPHGRKKTGEEFPISVGLSTLVISTGKFYVAVIQDDQPDLTLPKTIESAVLIVEDEPAHAAIFSKILTTAGYTVDIAPTGETALELLSSRNYVLAIIDLNLPGISGTETAVKAREAGFEVPMIAISGLGGDGILQETADVGFVATVAKPVGLKVLLGLARQYSKR